METFRQKLKNGTHTLHWIEAENPKQSILSHKWSKDKNVGGEIIVEGIEGLRRFRDWLNKIDI